MKHIFTMLVFSILLLAANAQQAVPDTAFGNNGTSYTPEDNDYISPVSIIVQPDHKLLISTFSDDANGYSPGINMRRLQQNGMLDSSFGINGFVYSGPYYYGGEMALQKNGKIIMLSLNREAHFDSYPDTVWVDRYLQNGQRDVSFGNNGRVFIPIEEENGTNASSLVIRNDDRIVFIEAVYFYGNVIRQYLPDGKPDSSFGENGIVHAASDYQKYIQTLLLLPNNKLVAGGFYYGNGTPTNCLLRYNPNGSIDSSLGTNGVIMVNNIADGSATPGIGLALQEKGKLLLYTTDNGENAAYRYLVSGTPDPAFGNNGKVVIGGYSYKHKMAVQQNGKIVFNTGTTSEFTRYLYNGTPDASFGVNATLTVSGLEQNSNLILSGNKLIIAGGSYILNAGGQVEVAVYKPAQTGLNEVITQTIKAFPNPASTIINIQTDGKTILTLADKQGNIVITKTIDHTGFLHVSKLQPGVYYLSGSGGGNRQTILIAR